MVIGVIGGSGFLGSYLVEYFNAISINRENYNNYIDRFFDVIINANGNSKKYWAENNKVDDFKKSVLSVYSTLMDFKFNKYIYISSIDAISKEKTVYGFHKHIAEEILNNYVREKLAVLRPVSIVGPKLKKGVIFDILHDRDVFVTPDSRLGFISTRAIAYIINEVVKRNLVGEYNIGSIDTLTPLEIAEILGKKVKFSDKAVRQIYNYNLPVFFKFKTAKEYILEGLNDERME